MEIYKSRYNITLSIYNPVVPPRLGKISGHIIDCLSKLGYKNTKIKQLKCFRISLKSVTHTDIEEVNGFLIRKEDLLVILTLESTLKYISERSSYLDKNIEFVVKTNLYNI